MELVVEAIGKLKEGKFGPYRAVKGTNQRWYVTNGMFAQTVERGATYVGQVEKKGEFDVFTVKFKPDVEQQLTDKLADKPVDKPTDMPALSEPRDWFYFTSLVHAAAGVAEGVFPDTESFDRSDARVALIQSILVAHSRRQFEYVLPEEPF